MCGKVFIKNASDLRFEKTCTYERIKFVDFEDQFVDKRTQAGKSESMEDSHSEMSFRK